MAPSLPRLLVTGASGFLGWNLCGIARQRWSVTGLVNSHRIKIPGCMTEACDLADAAAVSALVDRVRPHAVIHCAAVSQPNACEKDPEGSRRINVDAAVTIASVCRRLGIPLVFTSSEQVFSGNTPPYRETSPVDPVNRYGTQKAEAEQRIAACCPHAAICRMPLMFGDPGPAAQNFIMSWVKTLRSGTELALFTDEIRMPVSARTAAEGLLLMLEKQVHGVVHLAGSEAVTRYELGRRLCRTLGHPDTLLKPVLRADIPMAAPRPKDLILDSTRAGMLGYRPAPIDRQLSLLFTPG